MCSQVKALFALAVILVSACADKDVAHSGQAAHATEAGPGCGPITYAGCCQGGALRYCVGGAIRRRACGSGRLCGWNMVFGIYQCGGSAAADPSGQAPRSCAEAYGDAGALGNDGGDARVRPDAGRVDAARRCVGLSYAGCCSGDLLRFCSGGAILSRACRPGSCGWSAGAAYYACNTAGGADPSGRAPRSCSAAVADAAFFRDGRGDDGVDQRASDGRPDALAVVDQGNDGYRVEDSWQPSRDGPIDLAAPDFVGFDAVGFDGAGGDRPSLIVPSGGGGCHCDLSIRPTARAWWGIVLLLLVATRRSRRV